MVLPSTATPNDFSKCRHIFRVLHAGALAIVSGNVHTLTHNKVNKLNWALASEQVKSHCCFFLPPLKVIMSSHHNTHWNISSGYLTGNIQECGDHSFLKDQYVPSAALIGQH